MPARRLSQASTQQLTKTEDQESIQQTLTRWAGQPSAPGSLKIPPSTKIYLGIIVILIAAAINIGYESNQTITSLDLEVDNKARNCLLEFSKKQCSLANPTEECKHFYQCIRDNGDGIDDLIQVVSDQTQENYLPPLVLSTFLLIFQLAESVKQIKS